MTPRRPIYKCIKETCTKWSKTIEYNPDYGCSYFIGRGCDVALLFGKPIIAILCKSGVWVACHLSLENVCVEYYEEIDVCGL